MTSTHTLFFSLRIIGPKTQTKPTNQPTNNNNNQPNRRNNNNDQQEQTTEAKERKV